MSTSTLTRGVTTRARRNESIRSVVSTLPKRKSLWKIVRHVLLPRRLISTFASCGGGRRSRKVRKIRRDEFAPIPPPPPLQLPPTEEEDGVDDSLSRNLEQLQVEDQEQSPRSDLIIEDHQCQIHPEPDDEAVGNVVILRQKKSSEDRDFHGWRKSSIDISYTQPPVTLQWIPSGLQISDKVMWITDGQPERATVKWLGKIHGEYTAGIVFERRGLGNSSGIYGYGEGLFQRLFTCELGYGRFVPIHQLILHSDFHDNGAGLKAGFICVICRDDFLQDTVDFSPSEDEGHMVATKCGHLYHAQCLALWIANKRDKKGDGNPCPHCQSPIKMEDLIRLFPAQV